MIIFWPENKGLCIISMQFRPKQKKGDFFRDKKQAYSIFQGDYEKNNKKKFYVWDGT